MSSSLATDDPITHDYSLEAQFKLHQVQFETCLAMNR